MGGCSRVHWWVLESDMVDTQGDESEASGVVEWVIIVCGIHMRGSSFEENRSEGTPYSSLTRRFNLILRSDGAYQPCGA